MLVACTLGRSFSIVSFSKSLEPWFAEIVAWHGLSSRCASIRMLDGGFKSIDDVQSEKEELLVELANRTVKQDAADVVILAGAPLEGPVVSWGPFVMGSREEILQAQQDYLAGRMGRLGGVPF